MSSTEVPTRGEPVRRVAELAPVLSKHANQPQQNRRVHDGSVEAPAEAGASKPRRPKRHGGFEADTRALVDVATGLGCADGWTSWVAWMLTWTAY